MKLNFQIFILIVLLTSACNKDSAPDCFKKNGNEGRETRTLQPFNTVLINHDVEVHFFQGIEYKVELVGPKNLLKKITTTVIEQTVGFEGKNILAKNLIINNENTCNFVRGYKRHLQVYITAPSLLYIENNSVLDFTIDKNVKQNEIHLRCGNSGDIYLNGEYNSITAGSHGNGFIYLNGICDELAVYTNGINFIYAQNLIIKKYAFVASYSQGDVVLNSSQLGLIDYGIHSSGNIICKGGNPKANNNTDEIFGTGKFILEN